MKQKRFSPDFRLRVKRTNGDKTFIFRDEGKINYCSGSLTPLCLSNLLGNESAEVKFELEDVYDANQARNVVQDALKKQWRGNPDLCPVVEIIT